MTGATLDNDQARWVTVTEAGQLLNRSERTVRRMTKDGRLESKTVDGRLLVEVTGLAPEPPEPPERDLVTLQARVDILQAQVDSLQATIDRQDGEIDYLRGALAQALTLQTKAIEAPRERPWWKLWGD